MAEPQPSAATQAALGAGTIALSLVGTLLTIGFMRRFGAFEFIATATVGVRPISPELRAGNVVDLFPLRR